MDDLKLYADCDETLNKLVQTVHSFSKDIHMDFGLDKCAKCTIRTGKKVEAADIELDDGSQIWNKTLHTSISESKKMPVSNTR